MGNYRPFLQGPLPVANYTRIIIPGRFWTRPPSTKSTRMASSATPLHDSLIELAIPDAHAHAIKWYLNLLLNLLPCHVALNAISLALPETKVWVVLLVMVPAAFIKYISYQNTSSLGDDHVTYGTRLDVLVNQSNIHKVHYSMTCALYLMLFQTD